MLQNSWWSLLVASKTNTNFKSKLEHLPGLVGKKSSACSFIHHSKVALRCAAGFLRPVNLINVKRLMRCNGTRLSHCFKKGYRILESIEASANIEVFLNCQHLENECVIVLQTLNIRIFHEHDSKTLKHMQYYERQKLANMYRIYKIF